MEANQSERILEIVEKMAETRREPVLLVFIAPDGTTTLFVRDGLDLADLLQVLFESSRETRH